jgi:hypothetical protein
MDSQQPSSGYLPATQQPANYPVYTPLPTQSHSLFSKNGVLRRRDINNFGNGADSTNRGTELETNNFVTTRGG